MFPASDAASSSLSQILMTCGRSRAHTHSCTVFGRERSENGKGENETGTRRLPQISGSGERGKNMGGPGTSSGTGQQRITRPRLKDPSAKHTANCQKDITELSFFRLHRMRSAALERDGSRSPQC